MAVIPVARMLFELGAPAASAATEGEKAEVLRRCMSCRSEDEVRAEVEDAHARGVAEGWERGRSERIQSEEQIRSRLADEQDAHLATLAHEAIGGIHAGLERFRAETSRAVARTLVSFFQGRIELEAMEALSTELRHILTEKGAVRVAIHGPKSWTDRLAALPEIARGLEHIEVQASDAVDVTVSIDGTTLETTVGEWLTGLERVL